jgi:hypothetical protein
MLVLIQPCNKNADRLPELTHHAELEPEVHIGLEQVWTGVCYIEPLHSHRLAPELLAVFIPGSCVSGSRLLN